VTTPLLAARGLAKRYGATVALVDAAVDVRAGEVHALVGANGSGKSTLAKIITGLVAPDAGSLEVDGRPAAFRSPQEARAAGIDAVYQELSLVPDMSVEANIWLGHEPRGRFGRIDARAARVRAESLLGLFADVAGPRFRPETLAGELPPDERQLVEILKAASLDPRVLILDEATASLDARQVGRVFALVREWKAAGRGIVFVTHRLEELFAAADRATVLRNGAVVERVALRDTSRAALVAMMTGEADPGSVAADGAGRPSVAGAAARLEVAVGRAGRLHDLRVAIAPGEVVGLGGLQGQGQTELLKGVFGAMPLPPGAVRLDGVPRHFRHPHEAVEAGVAFVPGDRNRDGLLGVRPILENLLLPGWEAFRAGPLLDLPRARRAGAAVAERLRLKMASLDAPIGSLSGGNAQKVVLGRWLLRAPRVLLLDDPTKGIDVGAKAELYRLLAELRAEGLTVLFYSSDDDELVSLCDRVLVMLDGTVVRTLAGPELTRAALVRASLGAQA
jgi:ribose transport system ATP-binding protein